MSTHSDSIKTTSYSEVVKMNPFLDIFERFQTFFVGILGFTGVVFAIFINARIVRKDYKHRIMNERTTLRTALTAELRSLSNAYNNRIQELRNLPDDQMEIIPENVSNQVYKQLMDRVGLLTDKETEALIEAYLLAAELPVRLSLISNNLSKSPQYL